MIQVRVAIPECGCRPKPPVGAAGGVDEVEKDERPQHLAEVRGAHQASDRSVALAPGSMHDAAVRVCG
jgi:hypothetical protein